MTLSTVLLSVGQSQDKGLKDNNRARIHKVLLHAYTISQSIRSFENYCFNAFLASQPMTFILVV